MNATVLALRVIVLTLFATAGVILVYVDWRIFVGVFLYHWAVNANRALRNVRESPVNSSEEDSEP